MPLSNQTANEILALSAYCVLTRVGGLYRRLLDFLLSSACVCECTSDRSLLIFSIE